MSFISCRFFLVHWLALEGCWLWWCGAVSFDAHYDFSWFFLGGRAGFRHRACGFESLGFVQTPRKSDRQHAVTLNPESLRGAGTCWQWHHLRGRRLLWISGEFWRCELNFPLKKTSWSWMELTVHGRSVTAALFGGIWMNFIEAPSEGQKRMQTDGKSTSSIYTSPSLWSLWFAIKGSAPPICFRLLSQWSSRCFVPLWRKSRMSMPQTSCRAKKRPECI